MILLHPRRLWRFGQPRGHIPPVGRRRVRAAKRTAPRCQQFIVGHPVQTASTMGIAGITRPGSCRRMLDPSASDGVEVHVSGHRPEVGLIFHQFGTIAALEDMPRKAMPARPTIGIGGEKRLHAAAEVGLRGLENNVQVVGHERESVNAPGAANCGSTEVL
jgi:hypothetical protein